MAAIITDHLGNKYYTSGYTPKTFLDNARENGLKSAWEQDKYQTKGDIENIIDEAAFGCFFGVASLFVIPIVLGTTVVAFYKMNKHRKNHTSSQIE